MEEQPDDVFVRHLKDSVVIALLMMVYLVLVYVPLFQWDWDSGVVYSPDQTRLWLAYLGPFMILIIGATIFIDMAKKGHSVSTMLVFFTINAVFTQITFLTIPELPTSQIVALAICPTIAWIGIAVLIASLIRKVRSGEEVTLWDIGHWMWSSSNNKDANDETVAPTTTEEIILAPNGLILAAPDDFVLGECDEVSEKDPTDPDLIPEEVRPEDVRILNAQEYLEAISMGPTVVEDIGDVADHNHSQQPAPATTEHE